MSSSATPVRILLVDDYGPWRESARSILATHKELNIAAEAADGVEAVQTAQALQPDLILLDIGLPKLNGIEVARRIREISPLSKILFVSENRSQDIAQEALRTGGSGYVVKSTAAIELLPAIEAVLQGKRFLSGNLAGPDINGPAHQDIVRPSGLKQRVAPIPPKNVEIRHEVAFYRDDLALVDGFARLIEAALDAGSAVILIATEAHRADILQRLRVDGVDVDAASKQGSYIALDAVETVSSVMANGLPDPIRCATMVGDVVRRALEGAKGEHTRVAICGECAPTLLAAGNTEAAIRLEHLWDEITKGYRADTLCGYLSSAFPKEDSSPTFQRICAEHFAIHGRALGY